MDNTPGTYWATLQGEDFVTAAKERFKRFEDDLASSGDLDRMKVAVTEYFGEDEDGNTTYRTEKAGSSDQLRTLKTGHYASIVQNKLTIAKADTPAFIPVARNTDEKSQAQTLLAKALIHYEMDEGGDEKAVELATEIAEVMMWSWLVACWEDDAGPVVERLPEIDGATGQVTETVRHEGKPTTKVFLPVDAAFEFNSRAQRLNWLLTREWDNKHDVAAQAAAMGLDGQEIAQIQDDTKTDRSWLREMARHDSDEIPVYEFRHEKTPAVPEGRLVRFLSNGMVLKDGPLPYEDMAVCKVATSERFGTPRGYARSHDSLGLQKAVDVLYSIGYSSARALAGTWIWAPEGSNLTAQKLTESVTIIRGGHAQAKPEALVFHKGESGLAEQREGYVRDMANLQGMDDLSMGREERQLSGAAMALLDTRTQRAVSKLASAIVDSKKWLANQKIRLYRDFAAYSRKLPLIIGKTKQPMMRAFARDDLDSIDRVMVQTASPLMKQPAGRLEVANMLLQHGLIDARTYIAILETGQYEPATEAPMAKLMWARSTAERLAQGEPITPLISDDPTLCIPEWLSVLSTQEARNNPVIAENVLGAVQTMLDLWTSADPRLLAVLQIPPAPVPMMPGMPGADGTMPPAPGEQSATPPPEGGAPNTVPGQEPGMPSMPTNPATGEEFSPTGAVNV